MPLGKIMGLQLEDLEDMKDEEIIIHCKSGARSMRACVMLEQAGFKHVVNHNGRRCYGMETEIRLTSFFLHT